MGLPANFLVPTPSWQVPVNQSQPRPGLGQESRSGCWQTQMAREGGREPHGGRMQAAVEGRGGEAENLIGPDPTQARPSDPTHSHIHAPSI